MRFVCSMNIWIYDKLGIMNLYWSFKVVMGFDNTLSLLTGGCGFLWVLSTAWNCFFVNKYHEHIRSAMPLFVTEKSCIDQVHDMFLIFLVWVNC